MMNKHLFLLLCVSSLLTACAGGGGGGSSGAASNLSPSQFQTPEYNAQYGLGMVNAANLFAKGGTGSGVKVAVFDTGINPVEAQTGSSIKIDTANSYDYVANSSGSSSDANGHGTHVSGIIAAPKNDSGMHGIAFNATLLNIRVMNPSEIVTVSDGQLAAGISRAQAAGAMIINNSWGSINSPITSFLWNYPAAISAYQSYVANGGVVVFSAGNDGQSQVNSTSGLPYRIGGLQSGWLAAIAVDGSGTKASYSNSCGVAKAWCLAAPGSSIYSMYNNGSYTTMSGTSMAAPMVSGALASLKAAFPNLSYQQVRDRLLTTANKTGIYADSDTYGQGLMDLNKAANPVGGLSIPTSMSANGSVSSASNSKVALPSGLSAALQGQKILMVDGYQRAPFFVSASSLASSSPLRYDLGAQHLNSLASELSTIGNSIEGLSYSYTRDLNASFSLNKLGHQVTLASGTKSEAAITNSLGIANVPHLNDSATNTNGFGYASTLSETKIAFIGSMPNNQQQSFGNINLSDRSSMGNRNAYSVVTQKNLENISFGGSYSIANNFSQPGGLLSSGAFGLGSSKASSSGVYLKHQLFDLNTNILYATELTNLSSGVNNLASLGNVKYASFKAAINHQLTEFTSLSFGIKQQQALAGQLNLRLPSSVDEGGNIGYQSYSSGISGLVNSSQLNLGVGHRLDQASQIRGGVIYQQLPYGQKNTGLGGIYELRL